jgi:citrate synthase
MTMLSIALMALEGNSNFKTKYAQGLLKKDFWEATFDDALDLLGMLPKLAAGIYHIRYYKPLHIEYDPKLSWGSNYANMLDVDDPDKSFAKLINLFFVLHCDHEGGNVSALASRVVNSALSNLYLSTAAGLNGLAGPLHGLANQEALTYILAMIERFKGVPTEEQVQEYLTNTLEMGKVIPGYGHAVLRNIDPRFNSCLSFGENYCSEDVTFQTVKQVFKIAPDVLQKYSDGKVKNPWPNVDAVSGSLLYRYNVTQFDYYTVLFGVSRIIGFCAQAIIARGLMAPIIRPKTSTNEKILKMIEDNKKK